MAGYVRETPALCTCICGQNGQGAAFKGCAVQRVSTELAAETAVSPLRHSAARRRCGHRRNTKGPARALRFLQEQRELFAINECAAMAALRTRCTRAYRGRKERFEARVGGVCCDAFSTAADRAVRCTCRLCTCRLDSCCRRACFGRRGSRHPCQSTALLDRSRMSRRGRSFPQATADQVGRRGLRRCSSRLGHRPQQRDGTLRPAA